MSAVKRYEFARCVFHGRPENRLRQAKDGDLIYFAEYEKANARIAELTAEVARYKADAERVDWCEAQGDDGSMPYYEDGKFNVTWLSRRAEGVCTSQFNSLREAIDFARNALKDGV